MQVFHFGSSSAPLLGAYDPPTAARSTGAAVVICSPFGHEYVRTHRVLRNLATALAGAGVHVLRFDYTGCGDSAGASNDATVEQWKADVAVAIDELKDMAAVSRVSLIGVRFGAALAATAAASRKDIDALVLWDAVVNGAVHLRELRDLQARWLRGRPKPKVDIPWPPRDEIIGFPVPPALEAGFEGTDLRSLRSWPARRVTAVTTRGEQVDDLRSHVASLGRPCVHEQVDTDCEWRSPRAVHLTLLAADVIKGIVRVFEPAATV